jgi:hypothetical protein
MKTIGAILLTIAVLVLIVALLGDLAVLFIPLLVLGTSIWVLIDASRIGVKKAAQKPQTGRLQADVGPVGWFIFCLLVWIIAFPYYLVVRSQLRKKCPQCLGVVPDGARKCMHCGGDLAAPVVEQTLPVVEQPPRDSTIEEYERWKKSQEL